MKTSQAEITYETLLQERLNSGTSWTHNKEFDRDGFIVMPNVLDITSLAILPPSERGQYNYHGKSITQFDYDPIERQVEGSLSRYNHPCYKSVHYELKSKIEQVIGRKLYPTYFYDRFYFADQKLTPHIDRDACEISLSLHISSSISHPWGIIIKSPDKYEDREKTCQSAVGSIHSVTLTPGDGILYKGCECIHWRDPMPKRKRRLFGIGSAVQETYYHQVFFHYVLQDGYRSHCAWDRAG